MDYSVKVSEDLTLFCTHSGVGIISLFSDATVEITIEEIKSLIEALQNYLDGDRNEK